jgi:hypothetical protein
VSRADLEGGVTTVDGGDDRGEEVAGESPTTSSEV